MNRKNLEEIIALVDKALLVADAKAINTEVEAINNTAFISMGGVLDSIKILAIDTLTGNVTDTKPEPHSIAAGMNDPSHMQKEAFDD